MKINVIGDIAGRYDELMLLLEKMPEADLILSVGDLVDRGPKSKQVIQWFMKQQKLGKAEAIYGNHEDMMVESCTGGNTRDWLYNGGTFTLQSYLKKSETDPYSALIPKNHIDWLKKRPIYFQTDDLFVSHAPTTSLNSIPSSPQCHDFFFIWNRFIPRKPQSKYMIHGHNGLFQIYKDENGTDYGMCIDDSHKGVLTGLHWPTKEIFTQTFLPNETTL